jgi:hypothetical protein
VRAARLIGDRRQVADAVVAAGGLVVGEAGAGARVVGVGGRAAARVLRRVQQAVVAPSHGQGIRFGRQCATAYCPRLRAGSSLQNSNRGIPGEVCRPRRPCEPIHSSRAFVGALAVVRVFEILNSAFPIATQDLSETIFNSNN